MVGARLASVVLRRMQQVKLSRAFSSWCDFSSKVAEQQKLLDTGIHFFVENQLLVRAKVAWTQWRSWAKEMKEGDFTEKGVNMKAVNMFVLRQLRVGWNKWQACWEEQNARQLMMESVIRVATQRQLRTAYEKWQDEVHRMKAEENTRLRVVTALTHYRLPHSMAVWVQSAAEMMERKRLLDVAVKHMVQQSLCTSTSAWRQLAASLAHEQLQLRKAGKIRLRNKWHQWQA